MKKSFKKGLSIALSAVMVAGSINTSGWNVLNVKAEDPVPTVLPTPLYYFDFDLENEGNAATVGDIEKTSGSGTGVASIHGAGTIISDAERGKVFQNDGSAVRTNWLSLPSDSLAHSADTKGMTVGFWVKASTEALQWSPLFSAYADEPIDSVNVAPDLALLARLGIELNVEGTIVGGIDAERTGGKLTAEEKDGNGQAYRKYDWVVTDAWHYYTATFDKQVVSIYVDGELYNQWTTAASMDNFYSNANKLDVVCLGGNQAWSWGDPDTNYQYDGVSIYNQALSAAQIQELMLENNGYAYVAAESSEPNCEDSGLHVYKKDNDTQNVIIPALGHTNGAARYNTAENGTGTDVNLSDVKCTDTVYLVSTCSVCGNLASSVPVKGTKHVDAEGNSSLVQQAATAPTLSSAGCVKGAYKCSECGEFFKDANGTAADDTVVLPALKRIGGDWWDRAQRVKTNVPAVGETVAFAFTSTGGFGGDASIVLYEQNEYEANGKRIECNTANKGFFVSDAESGASVTSSGTIDGFDSLLSGKTYAFYITRKTENAIEVVLSDLSSAAGSTEVEMAKWTVNTGNYSLDTVCIWGQGPDRTIDTTYYRVPAGSEYKLTKYDCPDYNCIDGQIETFSTEDGSVIYQRVVKEAVGEHQAPASVVYTYNGQNVNLTDVPCTAKATVSPYECAHPDCSVVIPAGQEVQGKKHVNVSAAQVAATAPTAEKDGNVAYYECADCHKAFVDAEATKEIKDKAVTQIDSVTAKNAFWSTDGKSKTAVALPKNGENAYIIMQPETDGASFTVKAIIKDKEYTFCSYTPNSEYVTVVTENKPVDATPAINTVAKDVYLLSVENVDNIITVTFTDITTTSKICDFTLDTSALDLTGATMYFWGNSYENSSDTFNYSYVKASPAKYDLVKGTEVAPTCGKAGTVTYSSTGGTLVYQIEGKPATGAHDYVSGKSTATCTKPGVIDKECSVCGAKTSEPQPALGHDFKDVAAKDATCTEDGYKAHFSCSRCELIFSSKENGGVVTTKEAITVSKKGHTLGEGATYYTVDGSATLTKEQFDALKCNESALVYGVCSVCNENMNGKPVAGKIHTFEETADKSVAPTCETAGTKVSKCKYDDTIETVEIPATGHSLKKVEAKAATCEAAGNKEHYACEKCPKLFEDAEGKNATIAELVTIAATGHKAGAATKDKEVAATCGKAGSYDEVVKCEVCTKELSRTPKTVDATGLHTYDDGVVTTKATCTTAGVKTYTCKVCAAGDAGHTKTETIPATGHSLKKVAAVAATATKPGNIAYYTCSGCGKLFKDEKATTEIQKTATVIKALGQKANRVTVTKSAYTLKASGKTQTIKSLGAKATGGTITYKSDNSKIAVSSKGVVTVAKNYAGSATITITASSSTYKKAVATVKVTVKKLSQKITVKVASKTFKYKDVKKASKKVSIGASAKGKVKYSVTSKVKKAGVSVSSSGKVTVKKGTKKGTYKVTVKAAAKGIYNAATKTVIIKVK